MSESYYWNSSIALFVGTSTELYHVHLRSEHKMIPDGRQLHDVQNKLTDGKGPVMSARFCP